MLKKGSYNGQIKLHEVLTCSVVSDDWRSKNSSHITEWSSSDVTITVTEELWAPENRHGRVLHIVVKSRVPVRNRGSTGSFHP